jgi:hypothetical protein
MASNIARRRAAKARRRKAVVAARRRSGDGAASLPLAERVRRAAAGRLHGCWMHDVLFEIGYGVVILTREAAGGELAMASFLVDVYCLGVKDAFFRTIAPWDLEEYLEQLGGADPLAAVDPSYARKLLGDAVRYAAGLGLKPHPDLAAVEALFGDVRADACDVTFAFGHEGKPFYVPGPSESPAQVRVRLAHLRRQLGDGGFEFMLPA